MSLQVAAGLRGRSKSPGRERSRSRDVRAPSPPKAIVPLPKKAKKYYDSDSTSESSESESDRDRRSARRAEPRYEDVKPRRAPEQQQYERRDEKPQRGSPPKTSRAASDHATVAERGARYYRPAPQQHESEHRDGRHGSYAEPPRPGYAEPSRYEYEKPAAIRHDSHTRPEDSPDRREHQVPGAFDYEYEQESREKSYKPPPAADLQYAHRTSLPTLPTLGSFHPDQGHGVPPPHAQYMQQAPPQGYYQPPTSGPPLTQGYYQPPLVSHPESHRGHSASFSTPANPAHYAVPEQFQYAQPPQQITYINKNDPRVKPQYTQTSHAQIEVDDFDVRRRPSSYAKTEKEKPKSHAEVEVAAERRTLYAKPEKEPRRPSHSSYAEAQVVEVHPGGGATRAPPSPGPGARSHRGSAAGVTAGLGALTLVAPGMNHAQSGGPPPGSPLLETYHGTWGSMASPMPSPLALPSTMDDSLSDLDPLEPEDMSVDSRHKPIKPILKKRVLIYDPEPDAQALAASLKHTHPTPEPIIDILPHLSDDNILALRGEYKKHIKVGGKGINIAKHIKLKVPGNFGKIAYATALGRWESEAHWANSWYQSGTSRRELLIESLMGRTNAEIRKIKEAFSDKRYSDSLEKCMHTELKKDKFRNAVLLVLEEKRMNELSPVSTKLVHQDAADLHRALVNKDGGETAMIEIIVVRSDTHLREVLKEFEDRYKQNFARAMIQKSRNLVGETLAHILNGVLNRPVRDALLIHQALAETSKDRTELLISRLVRFHWEPKHLERIKVEYRRKYGNAMEIDIKDGTKGDFSEFCVGLCKVGK